MARRWRKGNVRCSASVQQMMSGTEDSLHMHCRPTNDNDNDNDNDNAQVSFFNWRYFVFDAAHSAVDADPSDNITQVYFSAVTLESTMIRLEPVLELAVDRIVDEYFAKKEEDANPIERDRLEKEKRSKEHTSELQ